MHELRRQRLQRGRAEPRMVPHCKRERRVGRERERAACCSEMSLLRAPEAAECLAVHALPSTPHAERRMLIRPQDARARACHSALRVE